MFALACCTIRCAAKADSCTFPPPLLDSPSPLFFFYIDIDNGTAVTADFSFTAVDIVTAASQHSDIRLTRPHIFATTVWRVELSGFRALCCVSRHVRRNNFFRSSVF
jgi:hypothetical protein